MKIRYILYLYKQYCSSLGKEYNQLNIFSDFDFIVWLELLNKQTYLYRTYLDSLDIRLGNDSTIEIGKGKYDTLGKDTVTIVSPFAETLELQNSRLIIRNEEPLVIVESSIYSAGECNSFFTHNPFDISDIENLSLLHNIGLNICLGVYGKISDKDRISKIKMLKKASENMNDDITLFYDTKDDNYFGCIKSDRKVKRKVLMK